MTEKKYFIYNVKTTLCFLKELKEYSQWTYAHCIRTAYLAYDVAAYYEKVYKARNVKNRIFTAALLHDIGKLYIPQSILCKNGPLTEDERNTVDKHAAYGAEMLCDAGYDDIIIDAVRKHHKGGKLYPFNINRKTCSYLIPEILKACDITDAILSERPYKKAMSCVEFVGKIKNREIRISDDETVIHSVLKNINHLYM